MQKEDVVFCDACLEKRRNGRKTIVCLVYHGTRPCSDCGDPTDNGCLNAWVDDNYNRVGEQP